MRGISFVLYTGQAPTHKFLDSFLLVMLYVMTTVFFLSSEMIWLFVFFELRLIPISWMVLKLGSNPERLSALYYLVLYTTLASFPLLVSLVCLEQE